jgi:DNA-binding transcriptional MerR regulator
MRGVGPRDLETCAMITDGRSLEVALEQVATFLEHPPRQGTAQDHEFATLLEEIAQYQTELQSLPTTTAMEDLVQRAHDLTRAATALRHARDAAAKPKWSTFPDDGKGVGPTTGV